MMFDTNTKEGPYLTDCYWPDAKVFAVSLGLAPEATGESLVV